MTRKFALWRARSGGCVHVFARKVGTWRVGVRGVCGRVVGKSDDGAVFNQDLVSECRGVRDL